MFTKLYSKCEGPLRDHEARQWRTPIIESRVTILRSAASLQPSVPPGRSGSTMYRRSAVESCTATAAPSCTSVPNSASTARGSRTARALEN